MCTSFPISLSVKLFFPYPLSHLPYSPSHFSHGLRFLGQRSSLLTGSCTYSFPPNFQNNTINNPDSPLPLPYSYPIPLTLSLSLISSCLIPCIGCGCISNLRVSSSPSPTPPTQPFSCPSHIASVDRFDSFSHSPLTSSSIHFILSLSIFFYVSVLLCFPHLLITTHSQRTFMTVSFFLSFNVLFLFSSVCWFSILHLYWSSDINGIHHDFFFLSPA